MSNAYFKLGACYRFHVGIGESRDILVSDEPWLLKVFELSKLLAKVCVKFTASLHSTNWVFWKNGISFIRS